MNLAIKKDNLNDNPETVLKRAGYAYIYSEATKQGSFVRRLTREHYPRLHMYIEDHGSNFVFSLHLDQKKVSYKGSHAHSADYNGPVVETEINRLQDILGGEITGKLSEKNARSKALLGKNLSRQPQNNSSGKLSDIPSAEKSVGQGDLDDEVDTVVIKKSWLERLFD